MQTRSSLYSCQLTRYFIDTYLLLSSGIDERTNEKKMHTEIEREREGGRKRIPVSLFFSCMGIDNDDDDYDDEILM